MSNIEKYDKAFMDSLEVSAEQLSGLKYKDIDTWDSIGHMSLIASIEESFDIMLETDDVIGFNSYEEGKNIVTKYNILF